MKTFNFLPVFALLALASALISCAHHRDVRPGADGVHRVEVKSEDADQGAREAISQANHYCEELNKSAAFLNEEKKYTGSMDESDYQTAKTVSKVAQGVGSAAFVFGGRNESNLGGIMGIGGSIARGAIGEGYTVDMRFKCQ